MKIAIISVNLGGFDKETHHVPQSLAHDYFMFTDENFPPRFNSLTPRLQAKIPKFFGWQLAPGYDYYVWLDGSFTITHPDTIKWLLQNCEGVDFAVFKHDKRQTIAEEAARVKKGL